MSASVHPLLRVPARLLLVAVVALGLFLAGPVGDAHAAAPSSAAKAGKAHKAGKGGKVARAVTVAQRQVGDPYRYGSAGPSSFDCSGLIYYSFRQAGLGVPRTSGSLAAASRKIARDKMRKGDLMFFTSGGRVYHAAIFMGRKHGKVRMLHSPRTGERVSYASPWTSSWFGGTFRR